MDSNLIEILITHTVLHVQHKWKTPHLTSKHSVILYTLWSVYAHKVMELNQSEKAKTEKSNNKIYYMESWGSHKSLYCWQLRHSSQTESHWDYIATTTTVIDRESPGTMYHVRLEIKIIWFERSEACVQPLHYPDTQDEQTEQSVNQYTHPHFQWQNMTFTLCFLMVHNDSVQECPPTCTKQQFSFI